jgi:putative holliday junction resolvase
MITSDAAAFAAALPATGRLAGLDVGTRTIGLATSDATRRFATARHTLARAAKFAADLSALQAFAADEALAGLVVGLPLSMDGSDSPRTQSVRAFARNIVVLGLPILLWDERWSTQAVNRAMIAADVSRARRAAAVDKLAAAHILEGALARLGRCGW